MQEKILFEKQWFPQLRRSKKTKKKKITIPNVTA